MKRVTYEQVLEKRRPITSLTQLTYALETGMVIICSFDMHFFGRVNGFIHRDNDENYILILKPKYGKGRIVAAKCFEDLMQTFHSKEEFFKMCSAIPKNFVSANDFIRIMCGVNARGFLASVYEFLLKRRLKGRNLDDFCYTIKGNEVLKEDSIL